MSDNMNHEYSAGAVVFKRERGKLKYLLIKSFTGVFGFPKGHIEAGETEQEAAVREVFEETGIKAEQNEISFLGVKKFGAAMVYSFVLRLPVAPLFDFDSTEVVGHKIVSRSEFEKMKNEFNLGTWSRYIEYGETVFR